VTVCADVCLARKLWDPRACTLLRCGGCTRTAHCSELAGHLAGPCRAAPPPRVLRQGHACEMWPRKLNLDAGGQRSRRPRARPSAGACARCRTPTRPSGTRTPAAAPSRARSSWPSRRTLPRTRTTRSGVRSPRLCMPARIHRGGGCAQLQACPCRWLSVHVAQCETDACSTLRSWYGIIVSRALCLQSRLSTSCMPLSINDDINRHQRRHQPAGLGNAPSVASSSSCCLHTCLPLDDLSSEP